MLGKAKGSEMNASEQHIPNPVSSATEQFHCIESMTDRYTETSK